MLSIPAETTPCFAAVRSAALLLVVGGPYEREERPWRGKGDGGGYKRVVQKKKK